MIKNARVNKSGSRRHGAAGRIVVLILGLMLGNARATSAEPSTLPATASSLAPAAAPAPSTGPTEVPQKLLAWGSDGELWVALTRPPSKPSPWSESLPEPPVRLRVRAQADGLWHELPSVDQPIVSAAHRGLQAALLLEDGEWRLIDDGSVISGQAVPVNRARLLALGNDAESVWALAAIPGGIQSLAAVYPAATTVPDRFDRRFQILPPPAIEAAPQTRPATNPASTMPSSGAPATAGDVVSLIRFRGDRWVGECDLPASICDIGDAVSLAVVDAPGDPTAPYIAVGRAAQVRVFRRGKDNAWQGISNAFPLAGVRTFRLISGPGVPLLWLGAEDTAQPDRMALFKPSGAEIAPLECTRGSPPDMRALAWATGRIRSLYLRDKVLWECVFDPRTLQPAAEPIAIHWDTTGGESASGWRYGIVAAAMVLALAVSFRQREAMRTTNAQTLEEAKVRLAPLGLRAGAGVIDAVPVFAALFMMAARSNFTSPSAMPQWDLKAELIFGAGIVLYVAHTLLGEVFFGRTVGKAICSLRVVSLNGEAPGRWQLAGRNLLRVIDAGLFFMPLVMIPFSPLHQRAGDVAAGTLVVQNAEAEPSEQG